MRIRSLPRHTTISICHRPSFLRLTLTVSSVVASRSFDRKATIARWRRSLSGAKRFQRAARDAHGAAQADDADASRRDFAVDSLRIDAQVFGGLGNGADCWQRPLALLRR